MDIYFEKNSALKQIVNDTHRHTLYFSLKWFDSRDSQYSLTKYVC